MAKKIVVNLYFPVKVRSTETRELIYTLDPDELAYSLAISRDGQMLAAGCKEASTTLWNLNTGEKINRFQTTEEFPSEVRCVGFTPDNKILFTGWGLHTYLWDLETGKQMRRTFPGTNFVISEDGETILCDNLSTLRIIKFSSGFALHTLKLDYVPRIAMNQDSSKFATGRYDEGTLTIFNTSTAEEIITWKAHSSSVRGVIFCPDNQTIISGGEDKLIHFWNINTGEKIHTLAEHPYPVNSLSLSADGGTLVSTSSYPGLRNDLSSVINIWGIR